MKNIEVCLTPALYPHRLTRNNFIVVIVDVFRATTSICAALGNGVKSIIPVSSLEEARKYKERGYLVACERDGVVLDFADFGNSAFNFMTEKVKGETIAYSTTNGTKAIAMTTDDATVAIGAFSNISALTQWLEKQDQDILILCSGWKNKFNLEDTLFAGALTRQLLNSNKFKADCDAAEAAMDLWKEAQHNPVAYIDKAAHRHRLKRLGLDDVIPFSFEPDTNPVVPVVKNSVIINILDEN